ncbi:hypothetical protein MVEG_00006 [Podila verticillata NRRL 6337]|nr:hypothetical protein MVEG_00006 [Podila verticillata NRRL 6337]
MTAQNTFTTTRRFKYAFLVEEHLKNNLWTAYQSNHGTFRIAALKVNNYYIFFAAPNPSYAQSYWVKSLDGARLSSGKLDPGRADTECVEIARIHVEALPVKNGSCEVEICLSGDDPLERSPSRSHPEVMMTKLYYDTKYQDFSFAFSEESTDDEGEPSQVIELGAHKHVLAQWPYFRAMFEGGFSESDDDAKQVKIKDIKPTTFKRLLRHMYLGDLEKEDQPTTAFMDELNDEEAVSWEEIFIAAHRYDLEDLCQLAKTKTVIGLTPMNAVSFLFRSAYLYDELRVPVVKYAATSCASTIASKDFRLKYLDHPEFGALLHELFIEK